MTWFKVDDKLCINPKWLAVPSRARGLWVTAGSWCALNQTDGKVPRHAIATLGGNKRDADALVAAGLWKEARAGWVFHEWGIYQPDAASLKAKAKAEADGGLLGNHRRWHESKGVRVPSCAYCNGLPPDEDIEPPVGDYEHRVPDRGGDGIPDSPPNRPVPEPVPDSSGSESRGGYVGSGSSRFPPQRCGDSHNPDAACWKCRDARMASKTSDADELAAKRNREQAERDARAARTAAGIAACHACDDKGYLPSGKVCPANDDGSHYYATEEA